jgi:hypothetical protein
MEPLEETHNTVKCHLTLECRVMINITSDTKVLHPGLELVANVINAKTK